MKVRCIVFGHRWVRNYGYGWYFTWPLTCDRCGRVE